MVDHGTPRTADAAARMAELLAALSIETVISVDDSHALGSAEGSATEVTEEIVSSPDLLTVVLESLSDVDQVLGFEYIDPENESAVNDFLTENWSSLTRETQTELLTAARTRRSDREAELGDADTITDLTAPKRLEDIVGESARFVQVSLAEWRSNWSTLVQGPSQVLVLIDRSFINEEGGNETTGEELLHDLLQQGLDHVRAGLLTFTATTEDDEIRITRELREKHQAHADKIVAIGKFRLTEPAEFPAAIRMLLLVAEITDYRDLAKTAFRQAHSAVETHLDALHDYTLIGAIAAAQQEGTFELEHPLRLAQQVYQQELADAVRNSEISSRVLPRFREGSVGVFVNASAAGEQIREVLRADVFVPGTYINTLGLPVEIGDVFRVESVYPDGKTRTKGDPRYYVLLAQACDMSIRSNGERSNNLVDVLLQRLEKIDEEELQRVLRQQPIDTGRLQRLMKKRERMHVLGELEESSNQKWGVNFAQSIVVPTIAIDATVFQADGSALIKPEVDESRPMASGWLKRHDVIKKAARRMVEDYKKAEQAVKKVSGKEELLLRLGASLATATLDQNRGVTAVIDSSVGTVRYGIQRVSRVRSDIAVNIASLASSYNSRPAFEAIPVAGSIG